MYLVCAHVCNHGYTLEVRRQLTGLCSVLPCGFLGLNLGSKALILRAILITPIQYCLFLKKKRLRDIFLVSIY